MKWITHQAAAVGMALVLHLPVEGVLASCFGAVLPDMLDQRVARLTRNPQRTFNRIHRGVTHWFGWWLAIFLVAGLLPLPPHWRAVVLGVGFGALSHIVLDMLNPTGVPLHPFSRKNRFPCVSAPRAALGSMSFWRACWAVLRFFWGRASGISCIRPSAGQGTCCAFELLARTAAQDGGGVCVSHHSCLAGRRCAVAAHVAFFKGKTPWANAFGERSKKAVGSADGFFAFFA